MTESQFAGITMATIFIFLITLIPNVVFASQLQKKQAQLKQLQIKKQLFLRQMFQEYFKEQREKDTLLTIYDGYDDPNQTNMTDNDTISIDQTQAVVSPTAHASSLFMQGILAHTISENHSSPTQSAATPNNATYMIGDSLGKSPLRCIKGCNVVFSKKEILDAHYGSFHPSQTAAKPTTLSKKTKTILVNVAKNSRKKKEEEDDDYIPSEDDTISEDNDDCFSDPEISDINEENFNPIKNTETGKYSCPFPNCRTESDKPSALKRHIRTHTGSKPFKCKTCGIGFAEQGNLKRHTRTHTGEKPFQCEICDYTGTRQQHLDNHMKNKHA